MLKGKKLEYSEYLKTTFTDMGLPEDAVEFLVDLWKGIQALDDLMDGHHPETEEQKRDVTDAILAILVRLPSNPFYQQCSQALGPIVALQIYKWNTANVAESTGKADARSYMWRAGFYDVAAITCCICNKVELLPSALNLYGERFEDYMEEFHPKQERVQ